MALSNASSFTFFQLKKRFSSLHIHIPFLLFLIGIINVKIYVKAASLILYIIYIFFKKFSFAKPTIVTYFYLSICLIGAVSAIVNQSFANEHYSYGFLLGVMQWSICAGAFYFIYTTIKNVTADKIIDTVNAFFIINIFISFLQLLIVMIDAHSIMPYWIDNATTKYGVSTGDYLYGISGNTSVANAAICVLGGIYFLFNKRFYLSICCFLIMLLCTSNLSILFTFMILSCIFIFENSKQMRKKIILIFFLLTVPYYLLSPNNIYYIKTIYKTFALHEATNYQYADSLKIIGLHSNKKYGQNNPVAFIFTLPVTDDISQRYIVSLNELKEANDAKPKTDSPALDQKILKHFFYSLYKVPVDDAPLNFSSSPGKVYSLHQTIHFLKRDLRSFFFGAGMGNFSSKLAVKLTGLGFQGKYPEKYVYVSRPFLENHLYTILYYYCQNIGLHSVVNMPDNVYDQIAGEYGLIGIIAFAILYLGYFLKNIKKRGYAKYLLLVLLLFFNVAYWFEMACLTVIFELLVLIEIFVYKIDNENAKIADNGTNARI